MTGELSRREGGIGMRRSTGAMRGLRCNPMSHMGHADANGGRSLEGLRAVCECNPMSHMGHGDANGVGSVRAGAAIPVCAGRAASAGMADVAGRA